jgi:hypothetical protein
MPSSQNATNALNHQINSILNTMKYIFCNNISLKGNSHNFSRRSQY